MAVVSGSFITVRHQVTANRMSAIGYVNLVVDPDASRSAGLEDGRVVVILCAVVVFLERGNSRPLRDVVAEVFDAVATAPMRRHAVAQTKALLPHQGRTKLSSVNAEHPRTIVRPWVEALDCLAHCNRTETSFVQRGKCLHG